MLTCSVAFLLLHFNAGALAPANRRSSEARGVEFLTREVPRWARENHCYSCHNNGAAARALFEAARRGHRVPEEALADSTRWLIQPAGWDHNGGDGPSSDKKLARIAFTTALASAFSTGWVKDRSALVEAARRLIQDQDKDGSWTIEGEDTTSSPATYCRSLATLQARECVFAADPVRFRAAIERADAWLGGREVRSVTDAAVALMAASVVTARASPERQERCLVLLRRGQSDDGGWGPHIASPPEPFDTALVVLALARSGDSPAVRDMRSQGRSFLIAQQREDGSWTETTRPAGDVSYAQRIATSGWALLAVLESQDAAKSSARDPKR
jgi:hypothetical protein